MKKVLLTLLVIASLVVPTMAMAWSSSSFNVGFSGSNGYRGGGNSMAIGFSHTSVRGPRFVGRPMMRSHRNFRGYGAGYFPGTPRRGCRTFNHYRPYISEGRANWNAHSPSAMSREIYVSERVRYSGGRW